MSWLHLFWFKKPHSSLRGKKNVNECFSLLCKSGNLNWRGEVRDTGSSVATFPFSAAWRILFSSGRNYCPQSFLSSLTPRRDRGEGGWSAVTAGRDGTAGHQRGTWISRVSGERPINVVIWVTETQGEAYTDTFPFTFLLLSCLKALQSRRDTPLLSGFYYLLIKQLIEKFFSCHLIV